MSNLFKSKFLMGVLVVAAVVAGVAFANVASADCSITMTLRLGSSGAEVMCLQGKVGAGVDGKFGPMTLNAVKVWQAAHGLVADGVVGPMTRAALMAAPQSPVSGNCQPGWAFNPVTGQACTGTTPPPGSGNNGGLQGGAGSVESYTLMSGLSNEEVGEDEEDVEVAGLEIEADDGSDLEITAVKLVFDEGTAGSDFEDYATEVSVWMDGEEVGRVDADEFNDDNDWTKTISLDGAIVEAGDTGELTVAVSGVSNLDSADANDTWTVDFRTVRFTDADGVTVSEDPGTAVRTFSFDTFASATGVELKVALEDDSINDAHIINVDDEDNTDDVEVLSFTLKAEGSDINVKEIPVEITTGGMNIDDALTTAYLYADGEEIGSENFTATDTDETITFDDLDYDINEGDKVEFVVKVDVNDLDATVGAEVAEGDTIQAQITATERNLIDAEDASGEDLATGDMTGTAVGDAHAIYDSGIMVDFVSATETRSSVADAAGEFDTGEFKITFKATAFDNDLRLDKSCEAAGADAAGQGTEYSTTISAANTTGWTFSCVVSSSSTDTEDTANTFELDEDVARTFTLTTNVTPDEDSFVELAIASLNWGTATDDTNANYYTFNLDEFKTDSIFLNAF